MAQSISLAAYHILIKNRTTRSNVSLEGFKEAVMDAYDFLLVYLDSRNEEVITDAENLRAIRVKEFHRDNENRFIYGEFESGFYGYDSELYDIVTKERTKKTENQADMRSFYFLMTIPAEDSEGAILILQRIEHYGIKDTVQYDLLDFFNDYAPNYRMQLNLIVHAGVLEAFDRAKLKKVRFIKNTVQDGAENMLESVHIVPENYTVETSVSARKNKNLDGFKAQISSFIKTYIKGERVVNGNDLFKDIPIEHDRIKVELELDGKRKVMDLSNPFSMSAYYDVTDQITIENGKVVIATIDSAAREYLDEIEQTVTKHGLISPSQNSKGYLIADDEPESDDDPTRILNIN